MLVLTIYWLHLCWLGARGRWTCNWVVHSAVTLMMGMGSKQPWFVVIGQFFIVVLGALGMNMVSAGLSDWTDEGESFDGMSWHRGRGGEAGPRVSCTPSALTPAHIVIRLGSFFLGSCPID